MSRAFCWTGTWWQGMMRLRTNLKTGTLMTMPPPPPPPGATTDNEPYPTSSVVAAALCTLAAPFLSLIAALVLMGNERAEARKEQLRLWAVISGVWLGLGAIVLIAVLSSFAHSGLGGPGGPGGPGFPGVNRSGPCRGGIDGMQPPTYYESGPPGHRIWTAEYVCINGGTTTRRLAHPPFGDG